MFEFKLQAGCLVVVFYLIIAYAKGIWQNPRIRHNLCFDMLLIAVPLAIIFDGATAWTVNRMNQVPVWINLTLHGLFLVSMDLVTILLFFYMVSLTVGIRNKRTACIVLSPGIFSILLIVYYLKDLYFIHGKTTWYSMGLSVYVCFASLFIHFVMIFLIICVKHRFIQRRKVVSLVAFMLVMLAIIFVQIIFPEVLISSLLPTIAVVAIYINFEDPSIRTLQQYSRDMVAGFSSLVETRDGCSTGHIYRTVGYVEIMMNEMRKYSRYDNILTRDYMENVLKAVPLHDIGKIATPDRILQKAGALDAEDYEIVKQHAAVGSDIILKTFADVGEKNFNQIAFEIAKYHHEKWNGAGYPEGLKEEEIPLHARLMTIADVFDSLAEDRCYRKAYSVDDCFKIIESGAGSDFDPALVAVFLDSKEQILQVFKSGL